MTMKNQSMNKQGGFSLIEALVAFLILSIGMLGIASLQVISLRAGTTAALRTVAVIKAEEIVERMRANHTELLAYEVDAAGGLVAPGKDCSDSTIPITPCSMPGFAGEMAAYDVYKWKQDLLTMLPDGTTATIEIPDPANPTATPQLPWSVTVTINWKERDPSANAAQIASKYATTQDICGVQRC